jgi:hypothetical protein
MSVAGATAIGRARWLIVFTLLFVLCAAVPVFADSSSPGETFSPDGQPAVGVPSGLQVAEGLQEADLAEAKEEAARETVDLLVMPTTSVASDGPFVQLETNRKGAKAGAAIGVRVKNSGTQSIELDYRFELARKTGGVWSKAPSQPVFAPRLTVAPKSSGAWQRIRIDVHARPGLYRIRKWIKLVGSPLGHAIVVKATFRVH